MTDDTGEREFISLKQDSEIRERARSLGCTEEELREAIKAVGSLISLEHDDEICDWAMSLGCTEAELRAAVTAVGDCSATRPGQAAVRLTSPVLERAGEGDADVHP